MFFCSDKVYFVAMSIIVEEITELDKITELALALTLSERAQLLEALEYSLLSESERPTTMHGSQRSNAVWRK